MNNFNRILVVDDEPLNLEIMTEFLCDEFSQVEVAVSGEECLKICSEELPEIILLDVNMPGLDGYQTCLKLKEIDHDNKTSVIFVSAHGQPEDRIEGYKAGGMDYIVKPFEADELVLRLRNILKRTLVKEATYATNNAMTIGLYEFDTHRLELKLNGAVQRITEKEGELISFLVAHKNRLLKREEILKAVWKNDDFFSGRSMDVFISRLRKYFKEDATISIESIRSVGLEFKIGI